MRARSTTLDNIPHRTTKELTRISLLGLSLVCGAGLTFISQILFARTLSADEFGSLVAAFAVTRALAPFASFGISEFWLARFGHEGWGALAWFKPSLAAIALATLSALALGAVWAILGASDSNTSLALFLLLPMVMFQALASLAVGRYQLEERFESTSLWAVIPHAPRFLIAAVAAWIGGSFMGVVSALAGVYLFLLILPMFVIAGMGTSRFALVGHGARDHATPLRLQGSLMEVFSRAKWFAASAVFYFLHYQVAIVLLEALAGPTEAAVYGVAFAILSAVFLIPTALYRWYMMPKMHRWAWEDTTKLDSAFLQSLLAVLLVGVVIVAILLVAAPWVIVTLFGPRYEESVVVLRLLTPAVLLRFGVVAQGSLMVGKGLVRRKVMVDAYATAAGLVLGIVLIPEYGVLGSIAVTIAIEAMLVFFYGRELCLVKRRTT